MLIEQQIAERQTRAKDAVDRILQRPASGLYGDYRIRSASKKILENPPKPNAKLLAAARALPKKK